MEQKTEITKRVEGMDKVFATHVGNVQSDEEIYGSLLDKLFATYKSKNADYGSAFSEMFDELGIDYAYGKLREKMNRIKVLRNKPNMVENEGLEDALLDTAGYAILTLVELKKRNMEQKTEIIVEGTDKVFATHVGNIQSDEEIYGSLLDKLFTTYKAKNHDYSNAFSEMFDELGIDYAYGKLREKMNRIKVLRKKPNMVENEGLEDALLDTAGYAILTLVELKKRKR